MIRNNVKRKLMKSVYFMAVLLMLVVFAACADNEPAGEASWKDMTASGSMDLSYAKEFTVDYYDGGYDLININDGGKILLIPEDGQIPEGLPEDIAVLKKPVNNIYIAASAVMDHFCKLDALDTVSLSGTKAGDWHIDEAKEAMEQGNIAYAGKYNMPDYELITDTDCKLAIESMMITHAPEVKENLEASGIPVLIDRSSYESHPLGRSEWIKLYGLLTGNDDKAESVFNEQAGMLDKIEPIKEEKTVAFFYFTSSGGVSVRKSGDYVAKMIQLAGGKYIFDDLGDTEKANSTEIIQMEEFYAKAKDADYLIYSSTIGSEIYTINELVEKNALLSEFKALKNGDVYCTGKNMYQETAATGQMILDINIMLQDSDDMVYLHRLTDN